MLPGSSACSRMGVKATDVWLHLMTSHHGLPFQGGATGPNTNRLCQCKHEYSTYGGGHSESRCPKPRNPFRNLRAAVSLSTPVNVHAMGLWLVSQSTLDNTATLYFVFLLVFFNLFQLSQSLVYSDNLQLAKKNSQVLRDKIAKEVELGRIAGPFPSLPSQICRFLHWVWLPRRNRENSG